MSIRVLVAFMVFTAACSAPLDDSGVPEELVELEERTVADSGKPWAEGAAAERGETAVRGRPQGLVCGIAYQDNTSTVVNGRCSGTGSSSTSHYTLSSVPSGYSRTHGGDYGLSSGRGFTYALLSYSDSGVTGSAADLLYLPKGTACGLQHSLNNPGQRCLGFDSRTSCPTGWTRKYAADTGGGTWNWCEYQDPYGLCTTSACMTGSTVPKGLACGITHNTASSAGSGSCNGAPTTSGCPSGYTRRGYYDRGLGAGRGIGWCERNF